MPCKSLHRSQCALVNGGRQKNGLSKPWLALREVVIGRLWVIPSKGQAPNFRQIKEIINAIEMCDEAIEIVAAHEERCTDNSTAGHLQTAVSFSSTWDFTLRTKEALSQSLELAIMQPMTRPVVLGIKRSTTWRLSCYGGWIYRRSLTLRGSRADMSQTLDDKCYTSTEEL